MTLSVALALACLLFAGLNDFVFKLFARKTRPVGLYCCLIGCVWTAVFMAVAGWSFPDRLTAPTLLWGALSGMCSVSANLLLIKVMHRHEVGICSTIYRLNLVPAALMAFLFLEETITIWKLFGIVSAVGAVLFFYSTATSKDGDGLRFTRTALLVVLLAACLRAGMGLFYKYGVSHHNADEVAILVINGWFWILGGMAYHLIAGAAAPPTPHSQQHKCNHDHGRGLIPYGLLSGVLISGIVWFMILALKHGDASIVLPISQLSFVATSLLGAALLTEPFTLRKASGMALAVLCVVFMVAA